MTDAQRTRVTVDIYGHQYKLTGHSSVEYMKRVASLVDENMHKLASGYPRLDMPRIAVLAAVHMADEVFRLRQDNERLSGQSEQNKRLAEELAEAKATILSLRGDLSEQRIKSNDDIERIREERAQQVQKLETDWQARFADRETIWQAAKQERVQALQEEYARREQDWEAEKDRLERLLESELRKEKEHWTSRLADAEQRVLQATEQEESMRTMLHGIETELREREALYTDAKKRVEQLQSKEGERIHKIQQLEQQVAKQREQLAAINKQQSEHKERQQLLGQQLAEAKQQLAEAKRLIQEKSEQERELIEKLRREEVRADEAVRMAQQARQDDEMYERRELELREEIEVLKETLQSNADSRGAMERLKEEYEKLKVEYKKLQTEYNEWIELIEKS